MPDSNQISVLALCGSLRAGSYNRMAMNAAADLMPPDMVMHDFDIGPIEPYNEDVRAQGFPPVVKELRDRIAAADAILFVTPEYNYSVPGQLKNVIDWASRPPDQPFDGKPVGIMGGSPAMAGTARSQYHLRQICVYLNCHPLNQPEVMIPKVQEKFDEDGRLKDDATRKFIGDMLTALADWTRKLKAS